MEKKPLLSICIPAYNGAEDLEQCLNNIVCQFNDQKIKDSVEVIISDDASPDNTEEIGRKFQAAFSNIKYFRNEKNLGMDENTIASVVRASGKYCWHIGDDDFIQNGILKFLIGFLSQNEVTLLTTKYHPFVDVPTSLKEARDITKEKHIIAGFTSPEEFWGEGYFEGTLGIFIFDREKWLAIDRKDYQPRWGYYEIAMKLMKLPGAHIAYLNYPAFYMSQGYDWQKKGGTFFTHIDWIRVLRKLEAFGYEKNFVKKLKKTTASDFPKALLNAKNNDLHCSLVNFKLMFAELYEYPVQRYCAVMLFFIPNNFIKIIKLLRDNLKK